MSNEGLVLHLKLDRLGGDSRVQDASGSGLSGTIGGNPAFLTDETFGTCMEFDGGDDAIDLGNPEALRITGDQTIEMWLFPYDFSARRNPFAKAYGGEGTVTQEMNGSLNYYYGTGGDNRGPYQGFSTNRPIPLQQWTHLALVRDLAARKLHWYMNGIRIETADATYPTAAASTLSAVVGRGYVSPYAGRMAHLRVYNRAISNEEIRQDMEKDRSGLMAHLKLDRIDEGDRLTDASGNDNHGQLRGTPQLLPDDIFGACLNFNGAIGNFVALPSSALPTGDQATFSFWAWGGDTLPAPTVVAEAHDTANNRTLMIHLPWSDSRIYFDCGHDGGTYDRIYKAAEAGDFQGRWTHWAFTKDAQSGEMKSYLDGALWHSEAGRQRTLTSADTVTLGGSSLSAHAYSGKLAHFRSYDRVLSPEAINRQKEQDQSTAASFGRSYPLDFSLLDDDDQHVIYIDDDPAGHNLSLVIKNSARQSIDIPPVAGAADAAHHHFALRFRPGVLEASTLARIRVAEAGWATSYEQGPDGTLSLYLQSAEARRIDPGQPLTLTLQNLTADGAGGTRGTRVELFYLGLLYTGANDPLEGYRLQHLSIVNHRGRKHIPLHVGVVGSNTVLNDGRTVNHLQLHISNILKEGRIELNPADSEAPTRLIFSFDAQADGESKEWALGTASQVGGITIDLGLEWRGSGDPARIFTTTLPSLEAGEHINVGLTDIISSLPSGHTNLYLHYENIPGYWDGQFVLVLEKTPMLVRGRNVGIGIADPQAQLALGKLGSGEAGDIGGVQLHLSGRYNTGVNQEGTKLLIDSYNNDGRTVYPIYVKDENNNVDFYLRNRPSESGKPSMFFGGDVQTGGRIKDETGFVMPVGGIIMWSGAESQIPEGWALCNGQNGTPDLRARFIVGAGAGGNPAYGAGSKGEPDRHNHGVGIPAKSYYTNTDGSHRHRLPGNWYWRDFDSGNYSGIDIRGRNNNFQYTEHGDSNHRHRINKPAQNVTTGSNADHSRPKWFAMCFIMKK